MACKEEANAPGGDPLFRNRNALDSVRLQHLRRDVLKRKVVSCKCGQQIHRERDWYAMIYDGTLVCAACSQCCRCGVNCDAVSKKLACIDGMTMCYGCLAEFGHETRPTLPVAIGESVREFSTTTTTQESEAASSSHNVDEDTEEEENANANLCGKKQQPQQQQQQEDQQLPKAPNSHLNPKKDGRRPLRIRRYSPQRKRQHPEDDPCLVPPPYLGYKDTMTHMVCPGCQKQVSSNRMVVASMARVWHKSCFKCIACQAGIGGGEKMMPNANYQYCTCDPVQLWCTRVDCKKARLQHHGASGCTLGPVRPAGRW